MAKLAASNCSNKEETPDIGFLEVPTVSYLLKTQVAHIEDIAGSWMELIDRYVRNGDLPTDKWEARKLCIRAAKYVIVEAILFRQSFTQPLLRCLAPLQVDY